MSVNYKMTTLANAIRDKANVNGQLDLDQMAEAVIGIQLGAGKTISSVKCITRASNGQFFGDINGDGIVDNADKSLLGMYTGPVMETNAQLDIDDDGHVTTSDLVIMLRQHEKVKSGQVFGRIEITYSDETKDKFYCPVDI